LVHRILLPFHLILFRQLVPCCSFHYPNSSCSLLSSMLYTSTFHTFMCLIFFMPFFFVVFLRVSYIYPFISLIISSQSEYTKWNEYLLICSTYEFTIYIEEIKQLCKKVLFSHCAMKPVLVHYFEYFISVHFAGSCCAELSSHHFIFHSSLESLSHRYITVFLLPLNIHVSILFIMFVHVLFPP